jgi:hypothetical protein
MGVRVANAPGEAYDRLEVIPMRKASLAVLALSLAACAGARSTPASTSPTVFRSTMYSEPLPGCVAQTASRIPMKSGTCAGPGSEWSQLQMKNTGHVDMGDALRSLDPSITIVQH